MNHTVSKSTGINGDINSGDKDSGSNIMPVKSITQASQDQQGSQTL
jgi:hypothetical protein